MKMRKITKRVEWTTDHNKDVIALYFAMLIKQYNGEKFVKSHYVNALAEKQGRSKGSIETKLMNVSAIAQEEGFNIVTGYKALSNYSKALKSDFQAFIGEHNVSITKVA